MEFRSAVALYSTCCAIASTSARSTTRGRSTRASSFRSWIAICSSASRPCSPGAASHQTRTRTSFSHLLTGLIFDDAGHRMAPTQAQKKGRALQLLCLAAASFGNAATAAVGSVSRVPAPDVDDQVRKVVLEPRNKSTSPIDNTYAPLLIERIEIQQNRLVVQLKQDPDNLAEEDHSTIVIPWTKPPSKRARSILRPTSAKTRSAR